MLCPELRNPENRDEFNKLVERLGGKALDPEHIYDRAGYKANLTPEQQSAYYRAYHLFNEHNSDYEVAHKYLDNIDKTHQVIQNSRMSAVEPSSVDENKGMSPEDVTKHVETYTKNWKNHPTIEVVKNISEVPDDVKEGAASETFDGTRGIYNIKRNTIYMVSDKLHSPEDVQQAILHEGFHASARDVLGKELDPYLKQVFDHYGEDGLADLAKVYNLDLSKPNDRLIAAEEQLARVAESGKNPTLLQKVYAGVRDILRKMGFTVKVNDADIAKLLSRTTKNLETAREQSPEAARLAKLTADENINRESRADDKKGFIDSILNNGAVKGSHRNLSDYLTIDPIPKMSRGSGDVADAAVAHASSRIATPYMAKDFMTKVFGKDYKNQDVTAKTIDILNKDWLLHKFDTLSKTVNDSEQSMQDGHSLSGQAEERYQTAKEELAAIVEKNNMDDIRKQVEKAAANSQIAGHIDNWKRNVDQFYKDKIDTNTDNYKDDVGSVFGARYRPINTDTSKAWKGFIKDESKGMPVDSKPDVVDNATDAESGLMHNIGSAYEKATKEQLYKTLVDNGQATPIDDKNINAAPSADHVRVEFDPHKQIWVHKDIADELKNVLNTGKNRPSDNPLLRALTRIQLLQLTDAITHGRNILSVISRAQGTGHDLLRKVPVVGSWLGGTDMYKVMKEIKADTPEIRAEIAGMAKKGYIRPQYYQAGEVADNVWGKLQKAAGTSGHVLHEADTAARVLMNRYFDKLVTDGKVKDIEGVRRKYINQVGQYNSRLMSSWMRSMKDAGLAPFVVAGRNFNRQGRMAVLGQTGIGKENYTSNNAMTHMIGTNLMGLVFAGTIPMAINMATTGSVFGRDGTPLGAIDLGSQFDDEKGKKTIVDLLQMSGIRRGLRATGIGAGIEGAREGHNLNEILGQAGDDALKAQTHPWIGPGVDFLSRASTGHSIAGGAKFESLKIPEGGAKQIGENVRAALESQNPMLYSLVSPALQAMGVHSNPEDEDKGVLRKFAEATVTKPIGGALGIGKRGESKSSAQQMAGDLLHSRAPEGQTYEGKVKSKLHQEIVNLGHTGDKVGMENKIHENLKDHTITTTQAHEMRQEVRDGRLVTDFKRLSIEEAGKVWQEATPDEKKSLHKWFQNKINANKKPDDRRKFTQMLKE